MPTRGAAELVMRHQRASLGRPGSPQLMKPAKISQSEESLLMQRVKIDPPSQPEGQAHEQADAEEAHALPEHQAAARTLRPLEVSPTRLARWCQERRRPTWQPSNAFHMEDRPPSSSNTMTLAKAQRALLDRMRTTAKTPRMVTAPPTARSSGRAAAQAAPQGKTQTTWPRLQ